MKEQQSNGRTDIENLRAQNKELQGLLQQVQRDSENFLKNKDQEMQQVEAQVAFLETKIKDMVPKTAMSDFMATYNGHIAELNRRIDEEKESLLDERAKSNTETTILSSQLKTATEQNTSNWFEFCYYIQ